MELLNIHIAGFANIQEVDVSFGKFNALVALNNYGKSNVLAGFHFGTEFIKESISTKNNMMAFKPYIPINKHIDNEPFVFEVSLLKKIKNDVFNIVYGFSFEWIKDDKTKGQRIKEEHLRVKFDKADSKFKTYLTRNLTETCYLPSTTGRCDKPLKIQKNELAINKLLNFDDLFFWEIIKVINELTITQIDTLQDPDGIFRNIRLNKKKDAIVQNDYSLEMSDAANAGFFIYSLMKKNPKCYELLKDSMKSLLSNLEDFEPMEIDVKTKTTLADRKKKLPLHFPEKLYDIRVKEVNNNQHTSIYSLSSGSQKLFYVLAATIGAELNNIPLVTFEELENSIHPGLLQKLLIILDGLTTKTKIILSSHSPYLIQYLNIEKIKIGIPNKKGLAIFKEIKKTKFGKIVKIANEEGISVGDFIFDKMIEAANGDDEYLNDLCA